MKHKVKIIAHTPVINITGQNIGNTSEAREELVSVIKEILERQVASNPRPSKH